MGPEVRIQKSVEGLACSKSAGCMSHLIYLCLPALSLHNVLPLEILFLDHGSLKYSNEPYKSYSQKTARIHKAVSTFKAF